MGISLNLPNRLLKRQRPRAWVVGPIVASATGGLAMFFFDPDNGRGRRAMVRDRLAAMFRDVFGSLTNSARGMASNAYGVSQQVQHLQPEHWSVPNDATLTQRVETELFRDPNIPKSRININAEAGIVVLRGELDRTDQIESIEKTVSGIAGVRGVHNLLHVVGTPVPGRGSVVPAP
jgi:BON domain-containing protein